MLHDEWESSLQTTTPASVAKGKGVAGRTPTGAGVRFSTSPLTDHHRRMRMRLSALLPIEEELTRKLLPAGAPAANVDDPCVRAGSGWKGVLAALSANTSTLAPVAPPGARNGNGERQLVSALKGGGSRPGTADGRARDNPAAVLDACKEDIVALWEDPVVRGVLRRHNVRLQDMPGL